jgi:hypothetical protein
MCNSTAVRGADLAQHIGWNANIRTTSPEGAERAENRRNSTMISLSRALAGFVKLGPQWSPPLGGDRIYQEATGGRARLHQANREEFVKFAADRSIRSLGCDPALLAALRGLGRVVLRVPIASEGVHKRPSWNGAERKAVDRAFDRTRSATGRVWAWGYLGDT